MWPAWRRFAGGSGERAALVGGGEWVVSSVGERAFESSAWEDNCVWALERGSAVFVGLLGARSGSWPSSEPA